MYFDSHCHFDFEAFDADRQMIWESCLAADIKQMIIPGVSPAQWQKAADICQSNTGIYQAAGLHPWWSRDFVDASLLRQQLITAIKQPKCLAIGECGLDKFIDTPLAHQQEVLAVHLQLASETNLPLIIHCRKAHNELMQQLKQQPLVAGGVIHAFSGSLEMAESYWAMGFYLGIGGTITYERAQKTRETVKHLSLEAIVLETDAPDMPLQGEQGQRNSPHNLVKIAETLAWLRGERTEDIAAQTSVNAQRLFKTAMSQNTKLASRPDMNQ